LKIGARETSVTSSRVPSIVSFQHGIQAEMDVSGSILGNWMPAVHTGMTKFAFSFSEGECKIMEHFVVIAPFAN
jgi:hypothetical protein